MRFRPLGSLGLGLLFAAGLGLTGAPIASAGPGGPGGPTITTNPGPRQPEITYILFRSDDHVSMSGSTRDIERARRLRQGKEPLLWFRDGGQEYVIRDAGLLKQLEVLWKPVEEIGDAQGKIGGKMGALGGKMGALGSRQAVLGTRHGTLAVREAALDMRASRDSLSAADAAEIDKQRREIKRRERALDAQSKELENEMEALNREMAELQQQMDVLGQQMGAASTRAETELRASVRRALTSGVARPAR